MFRRRNKTKERQKKTEELVDLEAGHYNGGLQQQYLFTERDVNSAMDMARAALDGTRRRAEQAEGEAALLSVQLQENSKQLGKVFRALLGTFLGFFLNEFCNLLIGKGTKSKIRKESFEQNERSP